MKNKLDELDSIEWRKMEGGTNVDLAEIPNWIRDLLSPSLSIRDNALDNLSSAIQHSWENWETTVYALPFLLELLKYPETPDKHRIVDLIHNMLKRQPAWDADFEVLEQLVDQVSVFEALLDVEDDPKTRKEAGEILVNLLSSLSREKALNTAAKLRARLESESELGVSCAILERFSDYLSHSSDKDSEVEAAVLSLLQKQTITSSFPGVRVWIKIVLYRHDAKGDLEFAEQIPAFERDFDLDNQDTVDLVRHMAFVIMWICDELEPDAGIAVARNIFKNSLDVEFSHCFAGHFLFRFFPGYDLRFFRKRTRWVDEIIYTDIKEPITELTEKQKKAAMLVIESDTVWKVKTNLLALVGLPTDREKARQFVLNAPVTNKGWRLNLETGELGTR